MGKKFTWFSERASYLAGHHFAFIAAAIFIIAWAASGPIFSFSDTWQLIVNTSTTIVTFLMVFLIQNSQNRDSWALHAKLDEILSSLDSAHEELIGIEHLPLNDLQKFREKLEAQCENSVKINGTK